jgi:hypothetical protein
LDTFLLYIVFVVPGWTAVHQTTDLERCTAMAAQLNTVARPGDSYRCETKVMPGVRK